MLDKLIAPPTTAEAQTFNRIAMNDTPDWIDYQAEPELSPLEQIEALVSGIDGHMQSIRAILRKHPKTSIASLEVHFDDISDDAMRLAVKAMQHGRKE